MALSRSDFIVGHKYSFEPRVGILRRINNYVPGVIEIIPSSDDRIAFTVLSGVFKDDEEFNSFDPGSNFSLCLSDDIEEDYEICEDESIDRFLSLFNQERCAI